MKTKSVKIKLNQNQYDSLTELAKDANLSVGDMVTLALRLSFTRKNWS